MEELYNIVTQRPDSSLDKKVLAQTCPYCESTNISADSISHTLIGGDPDSNHYWNRLQCTSCKRRFTVEWKYNNVWLVSDDDHVLAGIPSCFEHYVYTCNCGGDVTRTYTKLDGISPVQALQISYENGECIRGYRIFYACDTCDANVETPEDYCYL